MTYRILCRREPWMSDAEWKRARAVRRMMLAPLVEANIPLRPYLHQYLQDYLVAHLLALRAERALVEVPAEDGAALPAPPAALLDYLGKQRDRARKLLQEIESVLPKPEPLRLMGAADHAKPIMEKFKHLEEEYFPPDFAFRISHPDTPGAPFRYPDDDSPITTGPHTPFDYAFDNEPAEEKQPATPTHEEHGQDTGTPADANRDPNAVDDETLPIDPAPLAPAPQADATPNPHRAPAPSAASTNTPAPRISPPPARYPQRPPPPFVAIVA